MKDLNLGFLARKCLVAFLVGGGAFFLETLYGISEAPDFNLDRAFVVALIGGVLAAGIRAVLALSPINLVPSDAQHTVVGK